MGLYKPCAADGADRRVAAGDAVDRPDDMKICCARHLHGVLAGAADRQRQVDWIDADGHPRWRRGLRDSGQRGCCENQP